MEGRSGTSISITLASLFCFAYLARNALVHDRASSSKMIITFSPLPGLVYKECVGIPFT